ncbi:MAG: mechanosensitive ion channel protein [Rhodobacteraceae bacterium]|nr:MAG: mechanosensitive ion channel protein [Paracoccaceae bacterium]
MNSFTGLAEQIFAAINHPVFLPILWLAAGFVGGTLVSVLWGRFIHTVIARDRDGRLDRIGLGFVLGVGRIVIWLFALMIVAHAIPMLNKVATALLASVSIVSIVIGLAAQSTLSNLVAGLGLVFYRPFRIGDKLQVTAPTGLEMGTVESVNLGYTVLSTFDNRRIVVPNAVIATSTTVNHTAVDPRILARVPFSIAPDADIDRARAVAIGLANAHPGVVGIVGCPVVALSAFGVDLSLRVWAADASTAATVLCDLLEQIKARFDSDGIALSFPSQSAVSNGRPNSAV